jgi:hypothetical protein
VDEDLERYQSSEIDRFSEKDVNDIMSQTNEDNMMMRIMELADERESFPTIGKYYTFVYNPKTPRIEYDEFPLIACVGMYMWGFKGLNYHWGDFRNYTWNEYQGLHVIYPQELMTLRSIPYQKFKINK